MKFIFFNLINKITILPLPLTKKFNGNWHVNGILGFSNFVDICLKINQNLDEKQCFGQKETL